ncbi:Ni/Fe-hydrogenase cytochrome b subunit [candidate division KSB1 bacterium]|nr:Ni/Fe-hydrogenase cytochrome b subunit [candidate division KSB1 bacterium]
MTPVRHSVAEPVAKKFFTPGVKVLLTLFGLGVLFGLYRFIFGLGSITHLNNQYPLGLWIGVDVATGVALAGGGFTTAALIHIFYRGKYSIIGRPAHLTAMLGYTFVAFGLMIDLGRWYNIWHPAWPAMWNGNSALFEVGICVMLYLTVLYIEFIPIVAERFIGNSPKWIDGILRFLNRILGKVMWFFLIFGVVLSCLHQSSLGTLMVIAPYKIHPLWYTQILPLLFLLSAIGVGFPMVIFEGIWAAKSFGRKIEMDVLEPLARMISPFIGLYFFVRIIDITVREVWHYVLEGSLQSFMFILEMGLGGLVPMVMLFSDRLRKSPKWLFIASTMYIVFGVLLNRVNVFFIAYQPAYKVSQYIPSIGEFMITIGLISALLLCYRIFVTVFPILPAERKTA